MLNLMIIHLVGLLSPGPDFFYVSRISAMSSRREAIGGVIGITIGVLIWATAAVLGLAIIFATMPIIQGIVMMLGGSYLVYLGIKMAKVKTNAVFDEKQNANTSNQSTLTSIMKGLLVNLSNAKVVILFQQCDVISFSEYYRNITNFDRTYCDYRRNFFIFLHHFGVFLHVLLQNSFIANIVAILIMQQG